MSLHLTSLGLWACDEPTPAMKKKYPNTNDVCLTQRLCERPETMKRMIKHQLGCYLKIFPCENKDVLAELDTSDTLHLLLIQVYLISQDFEPTIAMFERGSAERTFKFFRTACIYNMRRLFLSIIAPINAKTVFADFLRSVRLPVLSHMDSPGQDAMFLTRDIAVTRSLYATKRTEEHERLVREYDDVFNSFTGEPPHKKHRPTEPVRVVEALHTPSLLNVLTREDNVRAMFKINSDGGMRKIKHTQLATDH